MKKIFQTIMSWSKTKEDLNSEFTKACKRIIRNNTCRETSVYCGGVCSLADYVKCPNYGKSTSESWSCISSVESAHKWLADHGIKE